MVWNDPIGTIILVLACTSFVKLLTGLTVLRYGLGLTGFEFGIATLVIAFTLAVCYSPGTSGLLSPTTGAAVGVDGGSPRSSQAITALLPAMKRAIDPQIASKLEAKLKSDLAADVKVAADGSEVSELRRVAPLFLISELKSSMLFGCLILIPFVLIDLVIAHLLTVVGIRQLAAQVVALPVKLSLFVLAGGFELFFNKLI